MKRIYLFLVGLWLATACFAELSQFRFRHLTVDDGLLSNLVSCIMQDKNGFIWMGVQGGVSRYDGVSFTNYKLYRDKANSIGVSTLFQDKEGNIWIGSGGGIFVYNPIDETFSDVMIEDTIPFYFGISDIVGDENHIWISAYNKGVFCYSYDTQKITSCKFSGNVARINRLFIDSYKTLWCVVEGGESFLYRLDEETDTFSPYVVTSKNGSYQRLSATYLYEDSNRVLWIGTWNAGIYKLNRAAHELTSVLLPSPFAGLTHIHHIEEYSNGILLIGSDNGMTVYDYNNNEYILYNSNKSGNYSLSDKFVYPIFKDREGGLWIGTYYSGINYVPAAEKIFTGYAQSEYTNSLSGNIISRFCEDRNGNIWIASDDGGLNKFSPTDQEFKHFLPAGVGSFNVHALCMDDDDLWIGTYDGGIFLLDTKTEKFKNTFPFRYDLRSVYEIYKSRDGKIWFGTMINVVVYDKETKEYKEVLDTRSTTICIREDVVGNIWLATQGAGLYRYNPVKDEWFHYLHSEDENSIPNDMVHCLYQDEGGKLWIGTEDGFCSYEANSDSFKRYKLNLVSNSICSIVEDNHKLWLTTSMGLVSIPSSGAMTVFTKDDGLQSNVFVTNSGMKASDGQIYAGTVNGFNVFTSGQILRNNYVPPVVFTNLELNNQPVPVSKDGVLKSSLNSVDKLELSHDNNTICISYAALSYNSPSRNQYAYMLEGFDTEWNYVGNQTKALYSHLPAGSYVFRVKASNNDQQWNNEGASLNIVLNPPFYFSLFFKILYIVLALGLLLYLINYLLSRSSKKHQGELRRMEKSKEQEMNDARVEFFTLIAHEIRTPVSLIIAPVEKILKSASTLSESIQNDLHIIDRNSQRLLFLVNQFLDFRKVEQSDIELNYTCCDVRASIDNVVDRFKLFFNQRNVQFSMDCPDKETTATVDSEALNIILSNLLSNANKYTKDKIEFRCAFNRSQNQFSISVTDNGEGIGKEQIDKIFKPFYRIVSNKQQGTGIGLSIVKKYVEALHGEIQAFSMVGKGSTFVVTLPIEPKFAEEANLLKEEEVESEPDSLKDDILNEEKASQKRTDKPFLLIVEDNDEMLTFLMNSFSDEYLVSIAKDGKEALEVLNENGEINLIISDLMMPRMDGLELCKAIRENLYTCHVPFILLTAKTDMTSKVSSMNYGVDVFVEKPFSIEYLKACAGNLIELRKMLWLKFMKMPLVPLSSVSVNHYDEDFLNKLNKIIEENFSNSDMSVELLAEKLCISRSKLFVKIKNLTNCTPNELIQIVRLKKAAELLLENRYRINEICYMVGFNNHSYFSKCFQKQFGVKPQDFARSKKDAEPDVENQ